MSSDDRHLTRQDEDATRKVQPDFRRELSKLKFEKKNQSMAKLPPNLTVERRPLIHAPVASPFAGAAVQKVVYVSRNTPIMSTVKRVKKLLLHIEKRAMQDVDLTKDRNGMRKLAEANEKLRKSGEEVLVKASGRAMEQALKVGEWFRSREDELACKVEVRTGSVQAIDDIVEKDPEDTVAETQSGEANAPSTPIETHEKSLISTDEGHEDSQPKVEISGWDDSLQQGSDHNNTGNAATAGHVQQENQPKKRQRRGKRKKSILDEDASARIRWVKTVEVAISLMC